MIGERLAELRKDRGWKQEDLAQALGLSVHTIGSYEQDRTDPDDEMKVKIAKLFNRSLDYLLGATDLEIPLERKNAMDLPDDFSVSLLDDLKKYAVLLYEHDKLSRGK